MTKQILAAKSTMSRNLKRFGRTDQELYADVAPPFMKAIVENAEKRGFLQGMALVAAALDLGLPIRVVARYARERIQGLSPDEAMDACGLGRRNALRLEGRLRDAGFFGGGDTAVEEPKSSATSTGPSRASISCGNSGKEAHHDGKSKKTPNGLCPGAAGEAGKD